MLEYISEEDIKSYIKQFQVDKTTAIKAIKEVLQDYCKEQEMQMQEVYQDIIKSSY